MKPWSFRRKLHNRNNDLPCMIGLGQSYLTAPWSQLTPVTNFAVSCSYLLNFTRPLFWQTLEPIGQGPWPLCVLLISDFSFYSFSHKCDDQQINRTDQLPWVCLPCSGLIELFSFFSSLTRLLNIIGESYTARPLLAVEICGLPRQVDPSLYPPVFVPA